MLQEVAPDIFMITQSSRKRFFRFSVNIFVIAGVDGLVFDSGYGKKKVINDLLLQIKQIEKQMLAAGKKCKITHVLPSHGHWDHFSGATKLRDKLGLTLLVTEKMLTSIGSKKRYIDSYKDANALIEPPSSPFIKSLKKLRHYLLDELVMLLLGVHFVDGPVKLTRENATIIVNHSPWEMIPLPGHCDDAIVLYNRKEGILLCGDTILRTITTWLGPPKSDLKSYVNGLEFLLTLPNLKLILPAHGSPITEPEKRIKEAIRHRHKRTDEIRALISQSGEKGLSFDEIYEKIYPSGRFYEKYLQTGWILTTLEFLILEKEITRCIEGKRKVFRPHTEG